MRQTVKIVMMAVVGMCAATPVFAQEFDQRPAPQTPKPAMALPAMTPPSGQQGGNGQRPATPQAAPAAPAAAHRPDAGVDQTDANIKLTVAITDKGAQTTTKTVTLMVANMGSGRVRSTGMGGRSGNMELNVDANTELRRSGLVRASLTISYVPEQTEDTGTRLSIVNESVTIFLKDGVPTVITQAADPTKGTRSITVEVTASIVK